MKILRYLVDFAKNVAISRTAQIFFSIHLILLIIGFIRGGNFFPPFHSEYEPAILNILTIINVPITIIMMILCFPIVLLLIPFELEKNLIFTNSVVIFTYIGWQIQWAIIGYWIEKIVIWLRRLK